MWSRVKAGHDTTTILTCRGLGTQNPWTLSPHIPKFYMARENSPLTDLGSKIRRIRLSKHLSQEAFANKAGLDRTYVGQVERGESNISFTNLVKFANALGYSLSDLLEGIDANPAISTSDGSISR